MQFLHNLFYYSRTKENNSNFYYMYVILLKKYKMKKLPKCVYGHGCYSVCVNPNCSMPAFMCETGSKQFE